MCRFILKVIFFFFIISVLDQLYAVTMESLRQKTQSGFTHKTAFVCDSLQSDIVIFGSSRAHMHYNPSMISDSLGMTCYNCAHSGMGIIFFYGTMKMMTERYMPKVVIYDIFPVLDMMVRDDNINYANELRPYYNRDGIDSIFWMIDATERYKMLSGFYSYHSKFVEYFGDLGKDASELSNGYNPSPEGKVINPDTKIQEKTDYVVDSVKLYYLEKFIREYKDKTTLVFFSSPRFKFTSNIPFEPIAALCKKYGVPFYNHYTDSNYVFNNRFFGDQTHMTSEGADKYTLEVISELKNHIIHSK